MPSPAAHSAADPPARMRHCLVLLAPDNPPPTALLLGLTHRQLAPALVADAPSLIYHLITNPAQAVILVEPDHQPRLDELHRVLHADFPHLALWQYHHHPATGRPRLARFNPNPQPQPDPSPKKNGSAPADRLAQTRQIAQNPAHANGSHFFDQPAEVTAPELAMLLGNINPTPHPHDPRHHHDPHRHAAPSPTPRPTRPDTKAGS